MAVAYLPELVRPGRLFRELKWEIPVKETWRKEGN
jgi:hypothetical protein